MEVAGLGRAQVADMRAEDRAGVLDDAEGVLQLAAQAHHGRPALLEFERPGHVAAAAPDQARPAGHDACQRVVAAHHDRPVVQQEALGDAAQAFLGLAVFDADRLVGQVAAGHDQRAAVGHQQMLDGVIGQHQADLVQLGRHRGRNGRVGPEAAQHDRPLGRTQELGFSRTDVGDLAGGLEVGHHHGQGLGLALLALAQELDGLVVVGRDRQVKAADALDGQDTAGHELHHGQRQGVVIVERHAAQVAQLKPGAADRAGVGLGVEAPVGRVGVFAGAVVAELETSHRGARAVVGQVGHDRQARAAVGAVDEGVAVAPVLGIEEFAQAVGAGGRVGRQVGGPGAADAAGGDHEAAFALGLELLGRAAADAGPGRQLVETGLETSELQLIALDLDLDALGTVAHEAAQADAVGQAVDKGPESHALHRAAEQVAAPHDLG
ncbi:MAG: hypothetical protein BWY87_00100 [Deltaproteobacteria bacterium ADurb.Bin510]|nr:MAG: hypothetical protein BWY87_00100 [Deltaproteobacteria bacterium ADurb.Bin510]